MKKALVAAVAALLLVLPLGAKAAMLQEGADYVPFTLEADDGTQVDISKEVGKGTVILNFMNTVCSTCASELEQVKKFYEQNPKSEVKFLPIAVDMKGAATVKPYKEAMGYTFKFLLDPTFKTARAYRAGSTPHTVVINKEGKVAKFIFGYDDDAKNVLKEYLK